MAWLVRDGKVLASLEIAETPRDRARGLLGLATADHALLIERTRSVHSIGMRFALDVAFCDEHMVVIRTLRLRPWRVTRPVRRAACVIEVEAGAFEEWGLEVGDRLDVKG